MSAPPAKRPSRVDIVRLRAAERRRAWVPVASASAVVVIVLLAAWGFGATGLLRGIYRGGKAAAVASVEETHTQQSAVGMVEVPSLTGMTLDEAPTVVQAAGFALVVTEEGTPAVAASRLVTDQDPQAGTVAPLGRAVEIVVPPLQGSASLASSRKKPRRFVVVIDPGHQAHSAGDMFFLIRSSSSLQYRILILP